MRKFWKLVRGRLGRAVAVLLLVVAGTALIWQEPAPVQLFREQLWDRFVALHPRPWSPELGVRIVDIDEASLVAHGQWPWPRTRIARLVDALAERGARVIVFDVFFVEPDRASLAQVFEALGRDIPGYAPPLGADALAAQPENDRILAAAMARIPVVLGITVDKSPNLAAGQGRAIDKLQRLEFEDRRDQIFLRPQYEGAISSLAVLQQAAAANAGLDMIVDPDGITRRVPLLFRIGRRNVPALSLAAVQVVDGGQLTVLSRDPGIRAIKVGERLVPTDAYGRMRLYDSGSQRGRYISAADVLAGTVAKRELEGAIVVIGTGAEGLSDLRLTPLDRWVPGMETHVQAIEQMLNGSHLARPDWGRQVEAAATALFGLMLLLSAWFTSQRLPPWLIAVAAGTTFLGAGWFGFVRQALLFDPVLPAVTLLAAAAVERFLLVLDLRRERSAVRNAFSRYVAPAVVEQLAQDPDKLVLGGETREMTFLFSDVRGFTSISEGFRSDPQRLTRLINQFLTPMSDLIQAHRGTIDKYMGDCIMAFWNAPLDDPEHARHACTAALAMMRELDALNLRLEAEAKAEGRAPKALAIGIGLNTGTCVVGNMGSEQRFDYSVLGDAVNLASRLEGQSKTYGVSIVIGEATRRAAPEFAALELDLIAVKGKDEAVRIHALLGDASVAAGASFRRLAAGQAELLAAYRAQDWERAEALAGECRGLDGRLDALYTLYAERIARYRADPPGPGWAGVYTAESK